MFLDDRFQFFWIEVIALILDQVLETAVEAEDTVVAVMAEISSSSEPIFSPVYHILKLLLKFYTSLRLTQMLLF